MRVEPKPVWNPASFARRSQRRLQNTFKARGQNPPSFFLSFHSFRSFPSFPSFFSFPLFPLFPLSWNEKMVGRGRILKRGVSLPVKLLFGTFLPFAILVDILVSSLRVNVAIHNATIQSVLHIFVVRQLVDIAFLESG